MNNFKKNGSGGESLSSSSAATPPKENNGSSNEWMTSVAEENQYLANQVTQLEADKQRLVNELRSMSRRGQGDMVKLSDYEKVANSLHQLEEKSGILEKQLLHAKDYIDQLGNNTVMASTEEYEKILEEKQQVEDKLKTLEAEQQTFSEQQVAFEAMNKQLANKTTEAEDLTSQLTELQEKQTALQSDLDEGRKKEEQLNQTIEKLQQELLTEQGNNDPKISQEYLELLEENQRLKNADPKTSIQYLDLLEEKKDLEQQLENYNPKSTKEYLELLVTAERQRAQIAEMSANQEMIRVTEEEISDILSEAQLKARKIIAHAEEKAVAIVKDTEQDIADKHEILGRHDEALKELIAQANQAFEQFSNHGQKMEAELETIHQELLAEKNK